METKTEEPREIHTHVWPRYIVRDLDYREKWPGLCLGIWPTKLAISVMEGKENMKGHKEETVEASPSLDPLHNISFNPHSNCER